MSPSLFRSFPTPFMTKQSTLFVSHEHVPRSLHAGRGRGGRGRGTGRIKPLRPFILVFSLFLPFFMISTPLQDATLKSTLAWQSDLEALFHRAKDRFPDVVWALLTEEDGEPTGEQVYGHKGTFRTYPLPLDSSAFCSHSVCSRTTELPGTIFLLPSRSHIIPRPFGHVFSFYLSYPVRAISLPWPRSVFYFSLPFTLSPCIPCLT